MSSELVQIKAAVEALSGGGWSGPGPGIRTLPDSHTDFVLTVVVEDFSVIVFCIVLLALFAFAVILKLRRARSNDEM